MQYIIGAGLAALGFTAVIYSVLTILAEIQRQKILDKIHARQLKTVAAYHAKLARTKE